MDPMEVEVRLDWLPPELLPLILSFIPTLKELVPLALVSKQFNQIISDKKLWKNFCERWWAERKFKVDLNLLVSRTETEGKSWDWFGKCFTFEINETRKTWPTAFYYSPSKCYLTIGFFLNGKADGYCVQINVEQDLTFMGYVTASKRNGFGRIYWNKSGHSYEGNWVEGNRTGQGTYTWGTGTKYVGDFVNAKKHGKGYHVYRDGSSYQGDFANHTREGTGTLTWADGTKHEGGWKNDNRHGFGTTTRLDGSVFQGEWENDLRMGRHSLNWTTPPFSVEAVFERGLPVDIDLVTHPLLKATAEENEKLCTRGHKHLGQFFYQCSSCGEAFCGACYQDCHYHEHSKAFEWQKLWSPTALCECLSKPRCNHRQKLD